MSASDSNVIVSVVIPTHNRRTLLLRLLQSLEKQTLDACHYEVIIVHNHTNDGTEGDAMSWCRHQAFRANYFKKNYNGPARSRDFGARLAKGRYVVFIDDDCIAQDRWLESGVAAFSGDNDGKGVGLVQGMTMPVPVQSRHFFEKTITIQGPTVFYETCNIFYTKKAFMEVGGFSEEFLDEFYGEDTDLGWKVREAGYDIQFAENALVFHEVFRVSIWNWLKEPLYFKNLPYLVKKFPRLREYMYHYWFLTKDSCFFYYFIAGLVCMLLVHPAGGVLATPYFFYRYRNSGRFSNPLYKLARVAIGIPRAIFTWWALVKGSMRARSCLL